MLSHKHEYVINPKKYNRDIYTFRAKSNDCYCISSLACEECGLLVSDSICLCIGIFECPRCKYKNNVNKIQPVDNNHPLEYYI
jgi:hypothetical protein